MQKDASYHESAIRYNEEIAKFAEDLEPTLEHDEVKRWSRAVAKQHRFHAGRHKKALNKLQSSDQDNEVEDAPEPGPVVDDIDPVGTNPEMVETDVEAVQEDLDQSVTDDSSALCLAGFPLSMTTKHPEGKCSEQCNGGHPVVLEQETNNA
jgi:hypothetical protein